MLKEKPAIGTKLVRISNSSNTALEIVTVSNIDDVYIYTQGILGWRFNHHGIGVSFSLEEITAERLRQIEYQEMKDTINSLDINNLSYSQLERITKIIQED
jgi:hypothetical protein